MKNINWLRRALAGGCIAAGGALLLALFLNLFLHSVSWGGGAGYSGIQLTFDRCADYFGSAALATTVELLAVFLLGAAIGLATLPFDRTWTSMQVQSLLHFVLTGALALAVGWAYCWFGFGSGEGFWLVLIVYLLLYLLIWAVRWVIWYAELRRMRRALHLKPEKLRMGAKGLLRLISAAMLLTAVVFVGIALSCPTCGSTFYIFGIRIGADVWRAFYLFYVIVMAALFSISFFVKKK